MLGNIARPITEQQVRETLRKIHFPGFSRDIVSFGIVKSVVVGPDRDVRVALEVSTQDPSVPQKIRSDVSAELQKLEGIGAVSIDLLSPPPATRPGAATAAAGGPPRIAGVRHAIAIGSGKGGVGKSTAAVNLACALVQAGYRIGVMDADIYGPSVPKMMGTVERPSITNERLDPVEMFGLKLMSMALLMDRDAPVIWRGPMIMKAIQQFTHAVNWGELDVLLVDLPPGTGDAQLSLAQTVALDGGVIVTTPQDVALEVARRGIAMFEKVNVRILGILENMSYYVCPHCSQRDDIFGHGGAQHEAERLEVPLLGEIPLYTNVRVCGDQGLPIVAAEPDSPPARAFRAAAEAVMQRLKN